MNTYFETILADIRKKPASWLITGVGGFIGSNLLETLLKHDQTVVGLDNFSTGRRSNLTEVQNALSEEQWSRFQFFEGDLHNLDDCKRVSKNIDYVLHQAALGSVPRSIADPIISNRANVTGFLNMLVAARDNGVKKFVYAASSSTYGDHEALPKIEDRIGKPLSPYAVTKYVNELYADVFAKCYDFNSIGLRYFNVFGPRQDPDGAYAAVIPKWAKALIHNQPIQINGDGKTSRDFCFVENVVQANLLAATTLSEQANNLVYNIAVGDQTSLLDLYDIIRAALESRGLVSDSDLIFAGFREGDVRHSKASIERAKQHLGYYPTQTAKEGIYLTIDWYLENLDAR